MGENDTAEGMRCEKGLCLPGIYSPLSFVVEVDFAYPRKGRERIIIFTYVVHRTRVCLQNVGVVIVFHFSCSLYNNYICMEKNY